MSPRDSIFDFMGCLDIEQQLLKIIGQLVSCTSLEDSQGSAQFSYIGLQTAFCDAKDIKTAVYAVEVVLISLFKQLKNAHTISGSEQKKFDWAEE